MRIFLSYSTPDIHLVYQIANHLQQHAEVLFWAKDKIPGTESWPLIFQWIDQSDLVVVLITGNTISRAMSVGQEVGHAKAKSRPIIPIISPEVPSTELGFLAGITYQRIDPRNPGPALQQIGSVTMAHKQTIENQQALMALLGVVGLVWLGAKALSASISDELFPL